MRAAAVCGLVLVACGSSLALDPVPPAADGDAGADASADGAGSEVATNADGSSVVPPPEAKCVPVTEDFEDGSVPGTWSSTPSGGLTAVTSHHKTGMRALAVASTRAQRSLQGCKHLDLWLEIPTVATTEQSVLRVDLGGQVLSITQMGAKIFFGDGTTEVFITYTTAFIHLVVDLDGGSYTATLDGKVTLLAQGPAELGNLFVDTTVGPITTVYTDGITVN